MSNHSGHPKRLGSSYEWIDDIHEGDIADAARRIASWQGSTKANIYKVAKREISVLLEEAENRRLKENNDRRILG
jgi:hypothetical protein